MNPYPRIITSFERQRDAEFMLFSRCSVRDRRFTYRIHRSCIRQVKMLSAFVEEHVRLCVCDSTYNLF